MKGLLYKDWMTLIRSYRLYLLICTGFIIFSTVLPENTFWAPYGIFFLSTVVSSLSTLDEQMKWQSYCDILPITRKEVVTERYVLNAVLTFAVVFLFLILNLVFRKNSLPAVLAIAAMMIALSFFTSAVSLPVNIRFGSAKAQMARMAIMIVLMGFCMAIINYGGVFVGMIQAADPVILGTVGLAAVILLYGLSWMISVRIYENKDL